MKYTTINGINFEIVTGKKATESIIKRYNWCCNNTRYIARNIFQAYARPSNAKIRIFDKWEKYIQEINGHNLMITGISCHYFSLMFELSEPNTNKRYIAYITASHNKLAEIQ